MDLLWLFEVKELSLLCSVLYETQTERNIQRVELCGKCPSGDYFYTCYDVHMPSTQTSCGLNVKIKLNKEAVDF